MTETLRATPTDAPAAPPTTRRLTLYAHADALLDVEAAIRERLAEIIANDGALPDDLAAQLDAAEGGFDTKLERVGLLARENRAAAAAAKAEAKRLGELAKSYEGTADALDTYALREMLRTGREQVKAPRLALTAVVTGTPAATIAPDAAVYTMKQAAEIAQHTPDLMDFYRYEPEEVTITPDQWVLDRDAAKRAWQAAYEVALAEATQATPEPTPAECRAYAEAEANKVTPRGVTFRRSVTLRTR